MPDWIAHLSFAYIIAAALRIKHKELVVIGAMIPDIAILWGAALIVTGADRTTIFLSGLPFHSLLFGVLLSGAIGIFLFTGISAKARTALLAIGMVSHLALDGIMLYTIAGVRPLIPLSYMRMDVLNILPSQSPLPAVVLGAVAIAVFLIYRKRNKTGDE